MESSSNTTTCQSYAQHGEDLIIWRLFEGQTGVIVDVGAHDGLTNSNSYFLEQHGWTSVTVEPNPELFTSLLARRSTKAFCCAAGGTDGTADLLISDGADQLSSIDASESHYKRMKRESTRLRSITVSVRRLDELLYDADIQKVDCLSIDVEGYELQALRGFSLTRWKPRLVIVEDNSNFRECAVRLYLKRAGYKPFLVTGCNVWYASASDTALRTLSRKAIISLWIFRGSITKHLSPAVRQRVGQWTSMWYRKTATGQRGQ